MKHNLLLLSSDKNFGGLIEFGTLWGRGQVILLRYRLINITRIVKNIMEVLTTEKDLRNTGFMKKDTPKRCLEGVLQVNIKVSCLYNNGR